MDDYILSVLMQQETGKERTAVIKMDLDGPGVSPEAAAEAQVKAGRSVRESTGEYGALKGNGRSYAEEILAGIGAVQTVPALRREERDSGSNQTAGNSYGRYIKTQMPYRTGNRSGLGISPEALSMYYQRDSRRFTREEWIC